MARSLSELLPAPFDALTLDDVRSIIADHQEERETLWLERKAEVTPRSLAKACSAFANTYGGLLIVGIANEDDELVGIAPLAAEAQLWVKDTLRGHVSPPPPFRARWVPTDGQGRNGILLVLVERSSTTPHVLIRSGAIYVRSPGSSDPVPIGDHRVLFELTQRGERAAALVDELAMLLPDVVLHDIPFRYTETIAMAATGTAAGFQQEIFRPKKPDELAGAAWGTLPQDGQSHRIAVWAQEHVGVAQFGRPGAFDAGRVPVSSVVLHRHGAVLVSHGHTVPEAEGRGPAPFYESVLRTRFEAALQLGRQILLAHGAHGDLRVIYHVLPRGRNIHFDHERSIWVQAVDADPVIRRWTDFETSVTAEIFEEFARALGIAPG